MALPVLTAHHKARHKGATNHEREDVVLTRPAGKGAHIIVLGNEKGGSGKSTTAMHIIMGLVEQGRSVAAIDLDSRQRTLSRYLENRNAHALEKSLDLALPLIRTLHKSKANLIDSAEAEERANFTETLAELSVAHDVVVIDCPGSDTYMARLAHSVADTIVTPLNDSFVDLDLLARVNRDSYEVETPSLYAEMVWEARKRRAMADRGQIDWIVMRNRVATLNARNKARVEKVLAKLARRIGFRFVPGLSERVVYREMFLKGLTLVDLRQKPNTKGGLTMSEVAARQELRQLVMALNLPPVKEPMELVQEA